MKTNTLKAVAALISIFVLGLAGGYLLNDAVSQSSPATEKVEQDHRERNQERRAENRTPEQQEDRLQRARRHMREHLALEEDQAAPLFELIRESREERREIMSESRRSFREVMERHDREFHEQLSRILTEDQLATWDSLYARSDSGQGRRR